MSGRDRNMQMDKYAGMKYAEERRQYPTPREMYTCTKPPRPVLTSVGYLPEERKEIGDRVVVCSDILHHDVIVDIMRLLTRRRLGAAAIPHLPDEVEIQV